MADGNQLFSFQGYIYFGERLGRKMLNPFWVGDAKMSIALETESVEHNESFSGQRLPYVLSCNRLFPSMRETGGLYAKAEWGRREL